MRKIIIGIILIILSITIFAYVSSNKNFTEYSGFLYILLGVSGFYLMLAFSEFMNTNKSYVLSHSITNKNTPIITKKRLSELLFIIESESGRRIIKMDNLLKKISETYQIANTQILEYTLNKFFYLNNENPSFNFVCVNGLILSKGANINVIIQDYLFEKKLLEGKELQIKNRRIKEQILSYAKNLGIENVCVEDKQIRYFILNEQDRYLAVNRMSMLRNESAAMLFLFINNYLVIENATAY